MPRALPVPSQITSKILLFSAELAPGSSPQYLAVTPAPSALPRNCFFNVETIVHTNGGSIQYGWLIWERPDIMYEAEFHSVWRNLDDRYVDVTPQGPGITEILFLPDASRRYEGRPIHNIMWPMRNSALLREYLALMNDLNRERDRGEVVARTSVARYDAITAARIDHLTRVSEELQSRLLEEAETIRDVSD